MQGGKEKRKNRMFFITTSEWAESAIAHIRTDSINTLHTFTTNSFLSLDISRNYVFFLDCFLGFLFACTISQYVSQFCGQQLCPPAYAKSGLSLGLELPFLDGGFHSTMVFTSVLQRVLVWEPSKHQKKKWKWKGIVKMWKKCIFYLACKSLWQSQRLDRFWTEQEYHTANGQTSFIAHTFLQGHWWRSDIKQY